MTDPVLIVGAGVTGLSAATALRAAGIACIVIEAAPRIGGRAHTTRIGAHAFDHGASWLHAAERNPLVDIALAAGETLHDADATRTRRLLIDHRPATEAELAARDAAYARYEAMATAEPHDISLAAATAPLADNPYTPLIEGWEACLIAAADPADFSVHDWRINALEGKNLHIEGGIGAFVTRTLAAQAGPVVLNTPLLSLDWSDGILARTGSGDISARACIITASTAALARIRFSPALPMPLDGLPMGLLTKIALRARSADRLGLAVDENITRRIAPGEPMLSLLAWPGGADHAVAFIGGPAAWELARLGPDATADFARTELKSWFGTSMEFGEALVTDWAHNPWHGGAYAYARPGHAQDRARLAEPFADGRVVIAGEACCTNGLAGTVGGAWLEGQRAAEAIAK